MTGPDRELDVVVWGASGFTGRLVAAYLLERYGPSGAAGALRWALGGRSRSKLEAVRDEIARETGVAADGLETIVGDADDEAFLASLARRTKVVCTTVGPYAKYGSKLVAACAAEGTSYCDLTGELPWMRRMIDAHQKEAEATGARIVHTCGFDSIPSDLGVWYLQREMRARHGTPAAHVAYRVLAFRGGFSGGTAASLIHMLEEVASDPSVRRILGDPYALNPEGERAGPDGGDRRAPAHDAAFDQWIAPFVMEGVNARVVRRTNALLGHPWGRDFRYDEATLTGSGAMGLLKAAGISAGLAAVMAGGTVGPLRRLLASRLPQPGEGPSKAKREAGFFEIRLRGERAGDPAQSVVVRVHGDRDPGYGSTAKMLGESAVCLATDDLSAGGGHWTPAAAMGDALLERLRQSAGLTFEVVEEPA